MASMRSKRSGVGVAVVGGALYAVGGDDGRSQLSSVERYDAAADKWTAVASMGSKRYGVGVVVVGGAGEGVAMGRGELAPIQRLGNGCRTWV